MVVVFFSLEITLLLQTMSRLVDLTNVCQVISALIIPTRSTTKSCTRERTLSLQVLECKRSRKQSKLAMVVALFPKWKISELDMASGQDSKLLTSFRWLMNTNGKRATMAAGSPLIHPKGARSTLSKMASFSVPIYTKGLIITYSPLMLM